MSVANRIDQRKLFPRNACGRPIHEILALRKYSAMRYSLHATYNYLIVGANAKLIAD